MGPSVSAHVSASGVCCHRLLGGLGSRRGILAPKSCVMPELPAEMRSWAAKIWSEMMAEVPWVDLSQSHRVNHKRPSLWFESQLLVSLSTSLTLLWGKLRQENVTILCFLPTASAWLQFHLMAPGLSLIPSTRERGCYLESPLRPWCR